MNPCFALLLSLIAISFGQTPGPQQPCQNTTLTIDKWVQGGFTNISNQNCIITLLSAASNSSVTLRFQADSFADDEDVALYNQYGNRINKKGGFLNSFLFWPPPLMYMKIVTNLKSNATLDWHAYPSPMEVDATVVASTTGQEPYIINLNNMKQHTKYVFRSATNVVLSTVNSADARMTSSWMNLFLYDGEGENAPLVGTVYNTINSENFVSSGQSLTIYCVFNTYNPGRLIVNDLSNVAQFSEIKTAWSYPGNASGQILLMDASKGPAVLTIGDYGYIDKMLVKDISFTDAAGSMLMYNGAPTAHPEPHMLATYRVSDFRSQLAQQLFTDMTTFVLNKGQAAVNVTISQRETNWNTARVGRSGFLSSPHYEVLSDSQDIRNVYFTPESSKSHYKFTFHLLKSVTDSSANYSIVVDNGRTVYNGLLNSNATSISVMGKAVNLTIYAGSQDNTGVLVRFEMSKHSSTVNAFLTVVCLLMFVNKWLH